eukprot:1813920-Lingulodinium_polyedra.AAC.1
MWGRFEEREFWRNGGMGYGYAPECCARDALRDQVPETGDFIRSARARFAQILQAPAGVHAGARSVRRQ